MTRYSPLFDTVTFSLVFAFAVIICIIMFEIFTGKTKYIVSDDL